LKADIGVAVCQVFLRPITAAAAISAVMLVVVRNMSGSVSTPSRIPAPSTGIHPAMRMGTITRIEPEGIPGGPREVTTTVRTIDSIAAGPRGTR